MNGTNAVVTAATLQSGPKNKPLPTN